MTYAKLNFISMLATYCTHLHRMHSYTDCVYVSWVLLGLTLTKNICRILGLVAHVAYSDNIKLSQQQFEQALGPCWG